MNCNSSFKKQQLKVCYNKLQTDIKWKNGKVKKEKKNECGKISLLFYGLKLKGL